MHGAPQAAKAESDQKDVAEYLALRPRDATDAVDVCIVGCGPAGLALAAEVAARGRSVCLVGPESKFTNNYGVWLDEFKALNLEHLLDHVWDESICYFKESEVRLASFVSRRFALLRREQGAPGLCVRHGATSHTRTARLCASSRRSRARCHGAPTAAPGHCAAGTRSALPAGPHADAAAAACRNA